jgi:hypothetical protein
MTIRVCNPSPYVQSYNPTKWAYSYRHNDAGVTSDCYSLGTGGYWDHQPTLLEMLVNIYSVWNTPVYDVNTGTTYPITSPFVISKITTKDIGGGWISVDVTTSGEGTGKITIDGIEKERWTNPANQTSHGSQFYVGTSSHTYTICAEVV